MWSIARGEFVGFKRRFFSSGEQTKEPMASDKCVIYNKTVRKRQQALQCDGCELWKHRTCGKTITQTYRKLVKGEV